jgi:hypothetical protein
LYNIVSVIHATKFYVRLIFVMICFIKCIIDNIFICLIRTVYFNGVHMICVCVCVCVCVRLNQAHDHLYLYYLNYLLFFNFLMGVELNLGLCV